MTEVKNLSCGAPSKIGGQASALYPSTELRVTARFFDCFISLSPDGLLLSRGELSQLIFKHFSVSHYFLGSLIKGGLVAGMYCRVGHDIGNRVAVTCLNRGIRLLAAAHAFHPVAYVVGGQFIAPGICRSYYLFCIFQAYLWQQIGLHTHSTSHFCR